MSEETKRKWVREVSEEFEKLAVAHAESLGFDYKNEPHGLFCCFMAAMVFNEGDLLKQAARNVRERNERTQSPEADP